MENSFHPYTMFDDISMFKFPTSNQLFPHFQTVLQNFYEHPRLVGLPLPRDASHLFFFFTAKSLKSKVPPHSLGNLILSLKILKF